MEPHFVLTRKGVRFFSDHYNRVNEAREKRGLPTRKDMMGPNNGEIKDHPFLGRKFRMKGRDKDVFTADQVYRQWYMGWHTRMFSYVNDTKSHAEHIIEAEGCQSEVMFNAWNKFKKNVYFIDENP